MKQRNSLECGSVPSRAVWVAVLTAIVLLVHGFHPAAEDGGIYTAGISLRLDPGLFPHDAEFVRAPMAYSSFACVLAWCSRVFHLPVSWAVFLAYIGAVALTVVAARRVARNCGYDCHEQLGALALLAAWWTLPVAGTSLNISDPYLTARSFSTPLSLLAISYAQERWRNAEGGPRWSAVVSCTLLLALAAIFHQLMFGFALMFVLVLRAGMTRRSGVAVCALMIVSLGTALLLCLTAPPESAVFFHAQLTRNYWFLSEWHWYEWCGLVAPLLLFAALMRIDRSTERIALWRACAMAGSLSVLVAALFAREGMTTHLVARLQPLRMFMLLYIIMTISLGALTARVLKRLADRTAIRQKRFVPALGVVVFATIASLMFAIQRRQFSASRHLEVPWRSEGQPNPWVEAFVWCRDHTSRSDLFAMDAAYIHLPHEDAQTFRATALRSVLPDQSKDGGEAAVDPALAALWQIGMDAQTGLNALPDEQRRVRLRSLHVGWVVLTSDAQTELICPFDNQVVKVCRFRADD